jgi:histidinol-phosphate aminotransferase
MSVMHPENSAELGEIRPARICYTTRFAASSIPESSMTVARPILHRGRRLVAKSIRLGRRVVSQLRQPSEIETLMQNLPVVQTATGLADKVVVITGSTQGVGLAVARAFAGRGARIVVNGRRADAVVAAVDLLRKEGANAVGITVDIATADGAAQLVRETVEKCGTFDILINNAAIVGEYARAWEVSAAEVEETIRINLTGPMLCTQEAVRWLIKNERHGRVINVSSLFTEGTYPMLICYGITKCGLEAMTRYFAADLPGANVVLTAVIVPSVQSERKFADDWASTELLPPVESVVPTFEFAATGPANLVHGRIFSGARFNQEPAAEAQLAGLASIRRRMLYPELFVDGAKIERAPSRVALLDRAENQCGTSPKAVAAIIKCLKDHPPAYYPNERYTMLTRALAAEHGLEPENFALGPGSWELISRIVGLFAKSGEEVVSSGPGWFGFNLVCQRQRVAQVLVPFDRGDTGNHPSHNLSAMRKAITPRTRLVYLISPSNPEGVTAQHADVKEFLESVPPELPVLIDEAYSEFANDPGMINVAALIRDGRRSIIGLRTFSKFYALAGMRVGYAYSQTTLAEFIRRQEQIFTISHAAEMAAIAALEDREHRRNVFEASLHARIEMQRGLSALGIRHIQSEAPYIMADAPRKFEELANDLARHGIVIARYRFHGDKMVMLPVGTQAQNTQILETLPRYM